MVKHPKYGLGVVKQSRYKGLELRVEFQDGLTRWVRFDEVESVPPTPPMPPPVTPSPPSPNEAFKFRRMIEAFRLGIVPHDCIEDFTFGRQAEAEVLRDWLNKQEESTLLVIGEYGTGKTHPLHYAYSYALREGFAVAYIEMDPHEAPFHKPKCVYSRLIRTFRYSSQKTRQEKRFRDLLGEVLAKGFFKDHIYFSNLIGETSDETLWDWIEALESIVRPYSNDMFVRIEGPLRDVSLVTALKHGDRPSFPEHLPNCLITTPESLDSLLCRRPQTFASLRTVILDEIHLLDNTYRGDQLRLLLWRLRKLTTDAGFSVHLLSATLPNPEQIAQRYVSHFELVVVEGQREMDYYLLKSHEEVYRLARAQGWKKLLCFCNLRESVETVAAELTPRWHPYPVVAHHGSLHRRVREEAEAIMKEAEVAVCVATSTLEIGIDIGDIDLVVLAEPPWSISALLQRVGRSNRREEITRTAAVIRSEEEKFLLEAMFKAATLGPLPAKPYEPDLSVAVQQTLSYLYQHPEGVPETELLELLAFLCSESEARLILRYLRRNGWIEGRTGYWFASTKLMDTSEKGCIHSNIPDSQTYRVIDLDSGKEIGTIAGSFDEVFVLARKAWKVMSVGSGLIKVRRFEGKASAAMFQRHKNVGAFYYLLPPDLKGVRQEGHQQT